MVKQYRKQKVISHVKNYLTTQIRKRPNKISVKKGQNKCQQVLIEIT